MSHFKYEINERSLRMQLKENSVPFSDEAWIKFESFSATQKNTSHENVMKRFQVSLNRNVVLPVVFGGVIILFSLLLFNFVNIKNPNQETAEVKAAAVVVTTPVVVEKKADPTPVIKEPVAVIKDTVIAAPAEEVKSVQTEEITKTPAPVQTEVQVQKKAEPVLINRSHDHPTFARPERHVSENNSARVETPRKKRSKKQLLVTEPTVEEDEQAPPPVSQSASGESQ